MTTAEDTGLVEMAWDPITRIVGSLGIYTKIDFKQKRVVECHSTSSIFRGYSIFMKGKDPRDAHFITSRICGICGDNHATCSVYNQNMAYGVRPPHLGEWIINLGEAAEYMFDHNIFQENLVGVDFCERMVGETNPGVLELANRTEAPHAADHGYKYIGDIMRSLNPLEGEFYREALQVQPLHPGDVLPDGGPPRAPLHALPGRRRHHPDGAAVHRLPDPADALRRVHEARRADARRPVRLLLRGAARLRGGRPPPRRHGLLGQPERPRALRLPLRPHDRLGPEDVRHPRRHPGRPAAHQRPGRDQPRHPDPARQLVLRGLGRPGDVRDPRPAGQPGGPQAPVEPAHHPAAGQARLRRQVQLGHVAALVRRQELPGRRHRRRPDRPAVGDRAGRPGRLRLRQVHRPQRADQPAAHRHQARGHLRVEDPDGQAAARRCPTRSSGTGPAPTSRPTPPPARCTSWRRRSPRSGPGAPRPGSRSTCRTRPTAAASPRPSAACCRTTW